MSDIALDRRPGVPWGASAAILGALVLMAGSIASGHGIRTAVPLAAAVVIGTVTLRRLRSWRSLIAAVVVIILFIPIKRYGLPASLPIRLEPYRLAVGIVVAAWLTSALIDPRVRLRRSHVIDLPLAAFLLAIAGSELANHSRVSAVEPDVVKGLLFFGTYIGVLFLVLSLVRSFEDIDFIVRVLVVGGAIVAGFALIESRTGYNAFDHLHQVLPILREVGGGDELSRGGHVRVFASAQHPIALGAALVMLVPLSLYRAICFRGLGWWAATLVLALGAMSTVSRTGMLMLVVIVLVFLWLRAREVKRLWPLALPALLLVHFMLPGAIGTFRVSFFPQGGLVAQQANAPVGSGRIATLGPALRDEFVPNPILGEGFQTRITTPDDYVPVPNAPILDDQWLGILLETGVVGALSLLWVFVRFVRRVGRAAKRDRSPRGWLLAATAASVAAFGESMFTYDAFSFIQVTFLLWIFIGLGCAAYLLPEGTGAEAARRAWPSARARPPERAARRPAALVD